MALSVTIWQVPGHARSTAVCTAMLEGINKTGDRAKIMSALSYRVPVGDVGLFYGLAGRLTDALKDYPASGRPAVYVDLGYWGRKEGGRFLGYHKMSVNGRHPTAYFQTIKHAADRLAVFDLKVRAWQRSGEYILLAGMGPKGAAAEGYQALQWEALALEKLRKHTGRPVIYRPKPNWPNPPALAGAIMAQAGQPIDEALAGAFAIVTHHSNAAIEALTAGVPAFVVDGAALPMASSNLAAIETPVRPNGRRQWLQDLAYTQFSIAEMKQGLAWRHLKSEGWIP